MAHKGSQAAAISKKSVFGNAAMLAACNGRNYLAQLMGVTVAWLRADQDRKLSTKKTVTGESQKNQKPSARESENVVPKVPRELV